MSFPVSGAGGISSFSGGLRQGEPDGYGMNGQDGAGMTLSGREKTVLQKCAATCCCETVFWKGLAGWRRISRLRYEAADKKKPRFTGA